MTSPAPIYLGIDSGATTCKVNGINADGTPLSNQLRQYPTRSSEGKAALLAGWLQAAETFLSESALSWDDVAGIGLAMPGPFLAYGVLGQLHNYPADFEAWPYLEAFSARMAEVVGRKIPVATANDGHLAGLAEARVIQAEQAGSVFLLAPGSGLGSAFVDATGAILEGDHLSGGFFCCMPIPYAALGLPRLTCRCGRDWGCAEAYTALSGLPQLIAAVLPRHPDHTFHAAATSPREQALALRRLAQTGDALALEVFDLQARAMGYLAAMASMAYDPTHIVVGGGLMDPAATTEDFRQSFMDQIKKTATRYLFVRPEQLQYHQAKLGEHSQAIGAALWVKDAE